MKEFKEVISIINKNTEDLSRYYYINIFRQLQSLGFCDCDSEGEKIFVCPPEFVLLYSNHIPRVMLVGARTPKLISQIKEAVEKRKDKFIILNITQQKDSEHGTIDLPEHIEITALHESDFKEIANECGIACSIRQPVCYSTLRFSAPIVFFNRNLKFKISTEINWDKRIFDCDKLIFAQHKLNLASKRLVEYTNPINNQKMYLFWKSGAAAEVNPEWGRYLILKEQKRNIIAYSPSKRELYVPITVPLPTVLARAATMCSGKIAYKTCLNEKEFLVYKNVPDLIAYKIAEKLGQELSYIKGVN